MKNKLKMIAGVAVALFGISATVQAIPLGLTLADNNGNSVNVPILGNTAAYVGAVGNWNVNIAGGIQLGTATSPMLDLSDNSAYFTAGPLTPGNVLTVTWSVGGLGPLAGGWVNDIGGTLNGTSDAFSILLNGAQLGSGLSFNSTPFSGSETDSISAAGNANVITLQAVLTANNLGAQTSFDDHWQSVPDGGATVMLLGAALSAMALIRRKLVA